MLNEISIWGQVTSWLEIAAMLTGIVGVWLTARQNILCFPIGIINVVLYAWLFFSPGIQLYADALLQCFYVFLLIFGWMQWSKLSNEIIVPQKIELKSTVRLILFGTLATLFSGYFFDNFTNASYPWLDSFLTCMSLAAQWMVAKKFIENWVVWIVANIIYIPLFLVKQLPLTAILYGIFLILAIIGYMDWKKKLILNRS
jgi:nicotinamide mononucleotide transporter